MSEILSDTSFYRLYMPRSVFYHPNVTFDRDPIKAESFNETIYTHVRKLNLDINANEVIIHADIETMWKTGNYNVDGSPFKVNRLTNIKQISQYYMPEHSVRYDVDVPFFMPTDRIYLNNSKRAVDEQWNIFTRKTGITRNEQKHMNLVDMTGKEESTTHTHVSGVGAPPQGGAKPPPHPPPSSGATGAGTASTSGGKAIHAPLPLKQQTQQQPEPQQQQQQQQQLVLTPREKVPVLAHPTPSPLKQLHGEHLQTK